MVTHMKTTVDLPDDLVRQVKRLAHEHGVTMRELMVDGLRHEIETRSRPAARMDLVFPTADGDGLQPGVTEDTLLGYAYDDLPAS